MVCLFLAQTFEIFYHKKISASANYCRRRNLSLEYVNQSINQMKYFLVNANKITLPRREATPLAKANHGGNLKH